MSISSFPLVSVDDIRGAAERIAAVARHTPLLDVSASLPSGAPRPLLLKCENLQVTGAFKIRGAYNMLAQLPKEERRAGVITFSSGNHGIALAYAARLLGVPAVIVMPTTAAAIKLDGIRRLGAEVIVEGTTTVERKARAEAEAKVRHLTIVPPFEHPWIIAGQGTIGLEILERCPDVATVYVQISGGGLISGIASAIKAARPATRIIGVEPAGAPKITASLAAGHPVTIERPSSIADGLLAVRPGDLTFAHVRAYVDEVVTIEDEAIGKAVAWLFREAKLVVEPSGAITVAAALGQVASGEWRVHSHSLAQDRRVGSGEGPVVAVLSGGNVSPDMFARLIT